MSLPILRHWQSILQSGQLQPKEPDLRPVDTEHKMERRNWCRPTLSPDHSLIIEHIPNLFAVFA